MTERTEKLRDNPIWKETFALAERIYESLEGESSYFPEEEEWNTKSKVRNAANDAMFYVSMAAGSRAAGANEYEWNYAKKYLSGLLTMYVFAGKRRFLKLDPDIVVTIEGLLAKIDDEISGARQASEEKERQELEPWLEKYRLWEKMHKAEPK